MSLFLDDHSRVVLKSVRDIAGSDYINANYVDVSYFSLRTFTTIIINDIYPGSFTHPKVRHPCSPTRSLLPYKGGTFFSGTDGNRKSLIYSIYLICEVVFAEKKLNQLPFGLKKKYFLNTHCPQLAKDSCGKEYLHVSMNKIP